MDVFDEAVIGFWKALNDNNVLYIMVGGFATNLHGYQRTTDDIDILLEDSVDNRKLFRQAFLDYTGIDYFMLETMQFVPGWSPFKLNNGFQLDILIMPMKGLEEFTFNDCYKVASQAEISGLKIPFLHINQLIANKKAVNRPKDQVDVIGLENVIRLSEKEN
ncbi:MAG: hypothetical protein H7Y86_20470 [Rhizobacter sp.]|nr:hypothetical protein [Ferruginibacter sp.]